MYLQTTATNKITSLTKRIRAVSGGTSASKTISILMWLISYAQTVDNKLISVVSETMPHLKKGSMRDFVRIMQTHKYFEESRWNRTDSIYTFETGSQIEFFSADQSSKVHGPRRDVLFVNEANNIAYETYVQLEIRTRQLVWLDWNPVQEFWWYTEVAPFNTNHDFLILTYKDNEALSTEEVKALEAHKNNPSRANWWRVYGLGLLGEAEGRIYKGWTQVDEIPLFARLEGYGMDFGYTNDPTAIVAIYKFNEGYILKEVTYRKGMTNKMIADTLLNLPQGLVIADSAEPKSIDEIASYGVTIVGAPKGRGSINQGIQFVQQQPVAVTKDSLNIWKEYRNYLWEKDHRTGKPLNKPTDVLNHAMDAVRYGLARKMVNYEEPSKYHPPDTQKLSEQGITSPWGGVGDYGMGSL